MLRKAALLLVLALFYPAPGTAESPSSASSSLPLQSPVYALWNGYLNMTNILELVNLESDPVIVSVTLYDIDGSEGFALNIPVGPQGQYDLIVNDVPPFRRDSYGILKVAFAGRLSGRMSFYRPIAAPTGGNGFEFAFSLPLANPLSGTAYVGFNTFQPSGNPLQAANQVANWLSVVNLDPAQQKTFAITRFGQAGETLHRERLVVPAFGRVDIDGGHGEGPSKVGYSQIVPQDPAVPYLAQLIRYGADAPAGQMPPSYSFAFPLVASPGGSAQQWVPISGGAAAQNWVEIVNISDSPVSGAVHLYNNWGLDVLPAAEQALTLPPHTQRHVNASAYLNGNSGSAEISANVDGALIGQSMFYFYNRPALDIAAMYGSQFADSRSSTYIGSWNLYLGMHNWLRVFNTGDVPSTVSVTAYNFGRSQQHLYVFPGKTGMDIPLHETANYGTSLDAYGLVKVQGANLRTELLRLKPKSDGGTDFAAPITLGPTSEPWDYGPLALQSFSVNGGASHTTMRFVTLEYSYHGMPSDYAVSESPDFAGAAWLPAASGRTYLLSSGNGGKTLYLKLRNANGETPVLSAHIALTEAPTTILQANITPSSEAQVASWADRLKLTIPSAALQTPALLTVSSLLNAPAHRFSGLEPLYGLDITLGTRHEFEEQPLTLTLTYDPNTLNPGQRAEDQLAVGYYDQTLARWIMLHAQIDSFNRLITVHLPHLSWIRVYKSKSGYQQKISSHFRFFVNPNTIVHPAFGDVDNFANKARDILERAYRRYETENTRDRLSGELLEYKMPRLVDVYIEDFGYSIVEAQYNGDIDLPPAAYETEAALASALGHELFHAVQNEYVSILRMGDFRWFMDAAAEFATGVVLGNLNEMGKDITPRYLQDSIRYDPTEGDSHKYSTAHFLASFLDPWSFLEMWNFIMDRIVLSDMATLINDYSTQYRGLTLGSHYCGFATNFVSYPDLYLANSNNPTHDFYYDASLGPYDAPLNMPPYQASLGLADFSAKILNFAVVPRADSLPRAFQITDAGAGSDLTFFAAVYLRGTGGVGGHHSPPSGSHTTCLAVPANRNFIITAINSAMDAQTLSLVIRDVTPQITSISPTSADYHTNYITLTGTGFSPDGAVPQLIECNQSKTICFEPQGLSSWSNTQAEFFFFNHSSLLGNPISYAIRTRICNGEYVDTNYIDLTVH